MRWSVKGIWADIFHALASGGQVAYCIAAGALLEQMPAAAIVHGDKGYDSDAVRRKIESRGVAPNIPPKVNRCWKWSLKPLPLERCQHTERLVNVGGGVVGGDLEADFLVAPGHHRIIEASGEYAIVP